jgi:tetratricopeptide (TPR) repeat protein
MRKLLCGLLLAGCLAAALPSVAQQVCPGLPYVANTPEDELMQAVNGAESDQEKIAALDKFAQAHADSKFIPCVDEYYTMSYLKMNNYDKVVEFGEKGLGAGYTDMMLILNVLKAYVASGKVSDTAFDIIAKAPDTIKAETNPSKPPNVSDADWQKELQDLAAQAEDERGYVAYAFFQLLPRVTDPNKRIEALDKFAKAFPDASQKNAGQINAAYFSAYFMANNVDKAIEFGEKTVASDPQNLETFNGLAYTYAVVKRSNLDKASEYAQKALSLAQGMKKPEGVADADFKKAQDNALGMAHLTLGYVDFMKAGKTRKVGPAIQELKAAADLLSANPELQGQALFYLGSAYEFEFPANHKGAIEVLTRASGLPCSLQGQSRDLLAKVRRVAKE